MGWIISTIVIGLVVGALARFMLPGEQRMGLALTCLLGIGGALVATWLGSMLGLYRTGENAGWIASVLGAALLLFVVGKFRKG